jgi:fused signal recognition particle receptor
MSGPFEKLKQSLTRTKDNLLGKISRTVLRRKIDDELLEEIEEILIEADVGLPATTRLIESVRSRAAEQNLTDGEAVLGLLREEITDILSRKHTPLFDETDPRPVVWLIVGVNGVGKTTTIGKLATTFSKEGRKAMIAACDTFRAAAIDQITIWAERSNVAIVKSQSGSDPA